MPELRLTRRGVADPHGPGSSIHRGGMKSTMVAAPLPGSNVVSRISVPGRYRRVLETAGFEGDILQRPFSGEPSRAAKNAGESKRGKQSQSIEPCCETRAAVSQSPTRA